MDDARDAPAGSDATSDTARDDAAPGDAGGSDGALPPDAGSDDAARDDAPTTTDAAPPPDAGSDDAGALPPTFLVRRGRLIFSDDFSSGMLAPNWQIVGGDWAEMGGHAIGSQPPGEADPNIGHLAPVDHAVIQFDFLMTGTGRAGIRLNHRSGTDPQHLVNVQVATDQVTLREMSGWASTTRSNQLAAAPVHLMTDRWYTGVFEIDGNAVSFAIEGRQVVHGTTVDQSATPRDHFVLQAYGASVEYDNVFVWEGVPR